MTCTNCVHFADCFDIGKTRYYGKDCACNDVEERCKFFKNKADFVEVVRCKDCKYAVELDKHCEINKASYRHCTMGRGDEEEFVWHKYKKYYKGYSIVGLDEYCSYGERKDT